MKRQTLTIAMTATSLAVGFASPMFAAPGASSTKATSASATQRATVGMDYFGNVTPAAPSPQVEKPVNNIRLSPLATMSEKTPVVAWFEHIDDIIVKYQPSDIDRVVMSQPLNEAERVQAWTSVAVKISKNYRTLSKELKAAAVPLNCPGLKDYRDLVADWYSDSAQVLEDLIKPRPPARTIEELNAGLDEIKQRTTALGNTNKQLREMDENLRKDYSVHLARASDPIWQFAHGSRK